MNGSEPVAALLTAAFFGIMVVWAIVAGVRAGRSSTARLRPFHAQMARYLSFPSLKTHTGPTYVRGKLLPVTRFLTGYANFRFGLGYPHNYARARDKVDPIYFLMSSELRPDDPSEVGTVAWLEWNEVVAGTYSSGAAGYICTVKATLIDIDIETVVGVIELRGGDPPAWIADQSEAHGGTPESELVRHLESLRRVSGR